jgi:hypothetical protein
MRIISTCTRTLHVAHGTCAHVHMHTPRTRAHTPYLSSRFYPKKNLIIYIFSSSFWVWTLTLDWTRQVLDENRRQGEEDQAFEKRVEGKKAAAKKRATRRSACFSFFFYYHLGGKRRG